MSETKEQSKSTPGPWTVDTQGSDDDFVIRSVRGKNMGGGSEVAIVTTGSYADAVEEANARLIAAAPDLLEACKSALAELDDRYDVEQPIGERAKEYPFNGAGELMRKLRAAIWKAEGR